MPTDDTIIRHTGHNRIEGHCRLRLYNNDGKKVVVVSEEPDNMGPSVTNAIEIIAAIAIARYGLDENNSIFIEHYPKEERVRSEESFDLVEFHGTKADVFVSGEKFTGLGNPDWKPLGKEKAEELCGEEIT